MRLKDSLRRCKTVSKTVGAHAQDSQTVCDDAKTVWTPVGVTQSVYDRQSPRPSGYLKETPRRSTTMPRPSEHLQKTHRQCSTAQEVFQTVGEPQRYSKKVSDGSKTVSAHAEDSQTVYDDF
ncbi:hypothetical protein DPMN_127730 [Dreissena polymorpha]|uniref:Uncharacterized protein n=1 Tax=Dreissena polymorpha TaxID=45954 RepID=A0A9D4JZ23_DREPO|nr:hypothetical protein DPMN_127730 [Dreissena polymorpha]